MRGRSRSSLLHGIVIGSTPQGEADNLITFYTKEKGRLSAIGKGARKIASKKRGALQVFNQVSFEYIDTGGLGLVTEAKLIRSFQNIQLDLKKLSLAFFFCEVTRKITPEHVPQPEIYALLVSAMMTLEKESKLRMVKNTFIRKILDYTGFSSEEMVDPMKHLQDVLERDLGSVRIGRMIQ